ncbi:MAG: lamin tail domain-containing protein, partial [Phycisphaerales bacterium]
DDASQYSGLRLRLLYDDGAVVYLNGIEAARRNLPGGVINFLTRANNNISGSAEYTFYDLPLDPNLLSTGINVLAVEIHQSSSTSADISFDLRLDGIMPPPGAGALRPGINRVTVETFDGPNGMGNKLERGSIDIWYDDGDVAEISGTLASDTTLDAASGPWYVTDDIVVPAGATLTIEPGTTLFFDTSTGIIIRQGGRLIAEGNEHERIRLTRLPDSDSRWDGIEFNQSLEDNNLSYVDMEYGDGLTQAISVDQTKLLIDNVTWTRTDKNVLQVSYPHLIIRNCVFPDHYDEEAIYGYGLSGNEYLIIQGNTFGRPTGYQDVIDFSDCHLPGPIIQIYDNVFLGGEDDGIDLDEADACIEGNVFMNFLGGGGTGTANAIAADQSSQITLARNIFYDNVNAVLLKGDSEMRAENNTFVGHAGSVVNFYESGSTSGKGAYMDGNIFWNNPDLFRNVDGQAELAVHRSILPTAMHHFGAGNIDADPLFVDPNTDFHLRPDSAAIGTGPCGLDMGAYVPSGAAICGEPDQITYRTDAMLAVGGPGITHYMYRLNSGPWSEEQPVDVPIELSNLLNGHAYAIYVIGENSAGLWQSENNPTVSRTWTIDTSYSRLVINEVLAHTHGADPDLIELYYDGVASLDLSGMSLTDDPGDTRKFVFSSGTVSSTIMSPGDYMLLYGDLDTQLKDHLGFALSSEGEGLYLYHKPANGGRLLDSVEFGPQINGLSIGRIGYEGTWKLNKPTLGQENIAQPLGDPRTLKINEWLANSEVLFENDFIELYNPHSSPVDLSSLYLTDNPVTQPDKCQLGPLSFIAGQSFAVFVADDQNQPSHVDFRLSADGEMIGLFDAELNEIDKVLYGPQTTDVSQGRAPDGADSFEFFELPTPGVANPLGGPDVATVTTLVPEDVDKRVLVPTGHIGQAWRTEPDFNDSSWAVCTGSPGGVGYERTMGFEDFISLDVRAQMYFVNATCYIRIPFTVEANELAKLAELTLKVRYDDGFVAYLNGVELPRRNFAGTAVWDSRASSTHSDSAAVVFEDIDVSEFIGNLAPGDNILAIQGMNSSSTSPDFLLSVELDAVITTSAEGFSFANALELLDGLRVTELMYHAADGSNFDYIELQNISETTLDLYGVRFIEG